MRLPVILLTFATLAAAVMAYGTHPGWADHAWGLKAIMICYRLQWPLAAVSLILCIVVLVVVISGKRRAWWLLGLAPVLALFVHRFLTDRVNRYAIYDEPLLVIADRATFVRGDDYVLGVVFDGQACAYPYAILYDAPIVVQTAYVSKMILMWSPHANAAVALTTNRELSTRDLKIVSDPADSLLLFNARGGQFIVAMTGRTPDGAKPANFRNQLAVTKTTWNQWRQEHPETQVIAPRQARGGTASPPTGPLLPRDISFAAASRGGADARKRVVLLATTRPAAVVSDQISREPWNLRAGGTPVLLFRDPQTQRVRAFERRVDEDLSPRFILNHDARRKGVVFVDEDTRTGWSAGGVAIDGDKTFRGKKLTPIDVQEDVYYGPAKFWMPDLQLIDPSGTLTSAPVRPMH